MKDDPSDFVEIARLWQMREKGFLPYPGSYMEQPNLFVECMALLDATLAEVERIRAKQDRLKRGEHE